jgi:hypothetical protein
VSDLALLFGTNEAIYLRDQFDETLRLYGIDATLIPIRRDTSTDNVYDMYDDIKTTESTTYGEPVNIQMVFEEQPTVKALKSLGWYDEGETLPFLGLVPIKYEGIDIMPVKDDVIEIQANPIDNFPPKKLLMKDFASRGSFPNVVYWVVKLVPYREDVS